MYIVHIYVFEIKVKPEKYDFLKVKHPPPSHLADMTVKNASFFLRAPFK